MSEFPPDPASTGKNKKKGCLFGCLGAAIGGPILLVVVGYFLLMHSSLPLKLVADLFSKDPNITIEGIGGSISKGFTVDSFRASDDSGNESFLEGLTLQWGDISRMRNKREMVIDEIGLKRAHIFIDTGERTTGSEAESNESDASNDASEPLNLFEIKKIDIRSVVVESKTGGFKLELDEFLAKGLRIEGDDFNLSSLSVSSNMLNLSLEDAETVMLDGKSIPFKKRIVGNLKSEIHENLIRDIDFFLELGAMDGEMVGRLVIGDGTFVITNAGNAGRPTFTARDFTPSDYFAPKLGGPVKGLSFLILGSKTDPKKQQFESGSFTLGNTPFTVEPQVVDKPEGKAPSFFATVQKGEIKITATISEGQAAPFFDLALSSEPPRDQREIISLLWFDKAHADLTADQAAEIEDIELRYFPDPS